MCDARHQELVHSLGAGTVIDYRREDFTANGLTYDLILDAVGKLAAWRSRRFLKPGGAYLTAGSADTHQKIGNVVLTVRNDRAT